HKCAHAKQLAQRHPWGAASHALEDVADTAIAGEQVLLEVEREQALRDAVTALPPRCRQLIQALFYETPARPYREIASQLNLANGSIGFIRGRCLGRLRNELHKNGFQSASPRLPRSPPGICPGWRRSATTMPGRRFWRVTGT